jgi:hypothetical protein
MADVNSNGIITEEVVIHDGDGNPVLIDDDGPSLVFIDWEHYQIHEGNSYKAGYQDTAMDTDDEILLCFTSPDENSGKEAHWALTAQCTGPVTIYIYKGPTLTDEGTAVTPKNRNQNSDNEAEMAVKHTPTVDGAAYGTKIVEKWIGSSGFKTTIGDEVRGHAEWIFETDEQYLVRMVAEGDAQKGAIGGNWYEIDAE